MAFGAFFHSMLSKFRSHEMSALEAGVPAPDFTLPTMTGETFSLSAALQKGPVLLVFFKISCPVCQFAMPYVERLFQATQGKKVTVIGVSQDDAKATAAFARDFKLASIPIALDDPRNYPASNAYGLTTVPDFFLIQPSGTIEVSAAGWSREEIEHIYHDLMSEPQPAPFFRDNERVPELKFG